MQNRIIVLLLAAITILLVLTGCSITDKTGNTEEQTSDLSTASKALENGKLAFADGDYSKAKSNFELALSEDKENKEAKELLTLVEDMELLSNYLINKEFEKAEELIEHLKTNKHFSVFESKLTEYENSLKEFTTSINAIDEKIESLKVALNNKEFDKVIEEGTTLTTDKNVTENQLTEINQLIEDVTTQKNEEIEAQKIAEEEKRKQEEEEKLKKQEEQNSQKLSLDEMRSRAKAYVDNWNGFDNVLLDEYDSDDGTLRMYEFKDGNTEHLIGVTVDYKTGEVTPDIGMY